MRLWFALRTSGLTMDSPLYVRMAETLGRGVGPLGPAHHGYSALIAIASLFIPGREWPARVVSIVASLVVIALTYRLARRSVPIVHAWVAGALVALHPLLSVYGAALMTEATFLALTFGALLVASPRIVPGAASATDPSTRRTAAAGALLGLGYCVRPEALVIAIAALPALVGARRRLVWLAAFVLAAAPEVVMLSAEHGSFTLTPKTALVAASAAARDDAEWTVRGADSLVAEPQGPLLERLRRAAPAAAARYPDRMAGTLARLLDAWPLPLLALSVIGAVLCPGLLLAPFALLLVLPAMGVTPNARFTQTLLPALAVFAAGGAAWLEAWLAGARGLSRRTATAVATVLLVGGLGWCWAGPAGHIARHFEDAPMRSLRRAGAWLGAHGRPGARVMDRKPYVPFFAGMQHELMPDDDYDTLVAYAQRTGVDYLVVEEYVMVTIRRQFTPLLTDPAFRAREHRLRMVFGGDEGPLTGIGIFEVLPAR